MPTMLTIRVRKNYDVISEFTVPDYRLDGERLEHLLRAIYVTQLGAEPHELAHHFFNKRKGKPKRSSATDLSSVWNDERREVGCALGTPKLHVEAVSTMSQVHYDEFKKMMAENKGTLA